MTLGYSFFFGPSVN